MPPRLWGLSCLPKRRAHQRARQPPWSPIGSREKFPGNQIKVTALAFTFVLQEACGLSACCAFVRPTLPFFYNAVHDLTDYCDSSDRVSDPDSIVKTLTQTCT